MDRSFVLSIIGDDQPGLVEEIAETVAGQGGNWLESRMSHLAGKFAGIVRVGADPATADALVAALRGLESRGLRIVVEDAGGAGDAATFRPVSLELVGADHPGIVREISRALHRNGVNIEELDTECVAAPMSGENLFRATAKLRLPADLGAEELRRRLEALAQSLMVDLQLRDVD